MSIELSSNQIVQIDSIRITGNDITEEYIIRRELNITSGDSITSKQLKFNQERVFSLGLFNKVKISVLEEKNINILEINVQESWYIYPLPYFKLRDDRISTASYGLILLYKNFRGRNETLTGFAIFGYDPSYILSYYNPVLITGKNLTFGFNFGYTDLQNRNIISQKLNGDNFSYNYIFGSISFGYRFNLFNRNLKQFSNNGNLGVAEFIHKGFGINGISYNIFNLDLRRYQSLYNDLSIKFRGLYRHTFGETIPFYALSLLGDSEYVRGHRFNKREGNNYLLSSLEINYPLIKEWNLSFDLPLLPKSLTSARIGLYANAFFDTGTTYYNGASLKINSFDSGWGFGFTLLILPYNAIRFEYGYNENNEGEFILESGFSF